MSCHVFIVDPRRYVDPANLLQKITQRVGAPESLKSWDESLHPRYPSGERDGGRFAPREGGASAASVSDVVGTGTARKQIQKFEKHFFAEDSARAFVVTKDGEFVSAFSSKGGAKRVTFAPDDLQAMRHAILTRNTPAGAAIGTSDLDTFLSGGLDELRVVDSKQTSVLKWGKMGNLALGDDGTLNQTTIDGIRKAYDAAAQEVRGEIGRLVAKGDLTFAEADARFTSDVLDRMSNNDASEGYMGQFLSYERKEHNYEEGKAPKPVKPTKKEKETKVEPPKPEEITAASVRKKIAEVSGPKLEKATDLRAQAKALNEQAYSMVAHRPLRDRYGNDKDYERAYDEYMKVKTEYHKSASDLYAHADTLEKEALAEARKHLYVDAPIKIEPDIKRKFPSSEEKQRALDSLNEFTKLVSVPISYTKVTVASTRKNRAFYSPDSRSINIGKGDDAGVIIHEMGHWLEDASPEVNAKALAFLDERTKGERAVPLSRLTGVRYRSNEVAKKDKFMHPYMGKEYIHDGKRYATEIVSMGLEYMYTKPAKFAQEDPEMFDFIWNTVRGK